MDQVKLLCLLLPIFSIAAWIVAVVASSYLSRCDDTLVHTFISLLSEESLETRLVGMGVDWIVPISFSLLTTSLIWWFNDWARILTGHWERWQIFCCLDENLNGFIISITGTVFSSSSTLTCDFSSGSSMDNHHTVMTL